jgi:hypothetical protein
MKSWALQLVFCLVWVAGCTSAIIKPQSPDDADEAETGVKLVGTVANPYGREQIAVEGIGLVVGLPGTGGDPPPSIYRAMLEDDMQKRGVTNTKEILASRATALVLVRGYLRPGMDKGDRFDLEVRVPFRSETTSLRGGYLMETRLSERAVVEGGGVRSGHLLALGQGPVLVDPEADDKADSGDAVRGRVLGGGTALKPHALGLLLRPSYQDIRHSQWVGHAVNSRFHTFSNGSKKEVATPKTDEFIELQIHPKYKENVPRYLNVVRSLPLRESPTQRLNRLQLLERQLLDPLTAPTAALRLEAIGAEGAGVLLKGLSSTDPEVQFYAAEALAYLDTDESAAAAVPLANAARTEPAFRVFALTALSAMNSLESHEQLRQLLSAPSAETRYGAFRALWAMNSRDSLVRGEMLGDQFSYHTLDTSGDPMIHLTTSFRPEVVLFGHNQEFQLPLMAETGSGILVNAPAGGPVVVSRFVVGKPDQKRHVSARVDDVIRAVVELDGTYPDVVQILTQAAQSGSLPPGCRLEIDAVPQAGRKITRRSGPGGGEESEEGSGFMVRNPLPDLFPSLSRDGGDPPPREKRLPKEKKPGFFPALFAKMKPGEN